MKKPFVISVASLSGGGKTAVANALKERLVNSAAVYFDDYNEEQVYLERDINEWSENGNNYNEWHVETVAADIERLLTEPYDYIILDYPFGKMNDCVGKYVDLAVFVDTPLDVALARRIIRDYTSRSQQSDFGLADVGEVSLTGLDKDLRFYLSHSRSTYARMSDMHKAKSDIVVDGAKSLVEIADEIAEKIIDRQL